MSGYKMYIDIPKEKWLNYLGPVIFFLSEKQCLIFQLKYQALYSLKKKEKKKELSATIKKKVFCYFCTKNKNFFFIVADILFFFQRI